MLLPLKSHFNSYPLFFTPTYYHFFVACSTPHEAQLFLRQPLTCDWGGVGVGGCGIVTAVCNCRPFAIVVSILATVAAYLPLPPLFSISQTRCSRGLDPRGYGMDGIQTGV